MKNIKGIIISYAIGVIWVTTVVALIAIEIQFAKVDYPYFRVVGRGTVLTPRMNLYGGLYLLMFSYPFYLRVLNAIPPILLNTFPTSIIKLIITDEAITERTKNIILSLIGIFLSCACIFDGTNNYILNFERNKSFALFLDIEILSFIFMIPGVLLICLERAANKATQITINKNEVSENEIIGKLHILLGTILQIVAVLIIGFGFILTRI